MVDAQTFFRLLWRKRLQLVGAALAGALLGFSVSRTLPRSYVGQGKVLVSGDSPQLTGASASLIADDGVQTEADILRSRALSESVIRDLGPARAAMLKPAVRLPASLTLLWHDSSARASLAAFYKFFTTPRDPEAMRDNVFIAAVNYIQDHLTVSTTEHSQVVSVRVQAGEPALAADVANRLMARYVADAAGARNLRLERARAWRDDRAAALASKAQAADAAYLAYLGANPLRHADAGGSDALTRFETLQGQLTAARDEFERLRATQGSASNMLRHDEDTASSQEVLASPVLQSLRLQETTLLEGIRGLAERSPERLRQESSLLALRQQISRETSKVLSSLSRETTSAGEKVERLQEVVDHARHEAQASSGIDTRLRLLAREAEGAHQIYSEFLAQPEQDQLLSPALPPEKIVSRAVPALGAEGAAAGGAMLLGALVGSFVLIMVVTLRALCRGHVQTADELSFITGLPHFGSLPELSRRKDARSQILAGRINVIVAETLRGVWLAVQSHAPAASCLTVMITSSETGEGKTTLAAALALRIAGDGQRVLLLEADLRRPSLSRIFGDQGGKLELLLKGHLTLLETVLIDPETNLHYLLARGNSSESHKLLASQGFCALLSEARRNYDVIILDTPPVMRVADAVLLARSSDITLFLVDGGKTSITHVLKALSRFPRQHQQRMATLLTRVSPRSLDMRDYYGGYITTNQTRAGADLGC